MKIKSFQSRDVARAALHDGVILASEPGLGKTLEAILWTLLKVGLHPQANGRLLPAEPVLIVAPENLHSQMMDDYKQLFGAAWPGCTELDSQQTFYRLAHQPSSLSRSPSSSSPLSSSPLSSSPLSSGLRSPLPPGWYISSFTAIASNKILAIPEVPEIDGIPDAQLSKLMSFFNVTLSQAASHRLFIPGVAQATRLSQRATPPDALQYLRLAADDKIPAGATEASIHSRAWDLCHERRRELHEGVDEAVNGIRCVFSPSLADLVRHAFGCVCIDEAVRIKSEDSIIGKGCRSLCPKYRLVLTGTPIKNRLPDIFFLAAWACDALDEANARWPYHAHAGGEQDRFAEEFMVMGRDLTKERKEAEAEHRHYVSPTSNSYRSRRSKKRKGKPTAEVCNIHRLWKLLAPVVLRRRKADIGEDIVPKTRRPVIVPMGTRQARVTAYHLAASYVDKNGMPAIGAQLQALRSCAAAPCSPLLEDKGQIEEESTTVGRDSVEPSLDLAHSPLSNFPAPSNLPYRSTNEFTPRLLACMRVVEEILGRREQVVIASAFHEPLDAISRLLTQAGIPHDVLDGRMTAARRGRLAMEFKRGLAGGAKPILLAGNRAMSEGNSWNKCNNLIQYCWDWGYDVAAQMQERVHRINSEQPVNIYPIICIGTVDKKLESMLGEKSDSAELVLDGKLIGDVSEEVNLMALLQLAHTEFTAEGTIDESECEAAWPALRDRLAAAYAALAAPAEVKLDFVPGSTGDPPVPAGDPPAESEPKTAPPNPTPVPTVAETGHSTVAETGHSTVAEIAISPPPAARALCPVCRQWRPIHQAAAGPECAACGTPLTSALRPLPSASPAPRRTLTLADLPTFRPRARSCEPAFATL